MNVKIFFPTFENGNALHAQVLNAFGAGIETSTGCRVAAGTVEECIAADIAVVFGVGKKAVPASFDRGKILDTRTALGLNTIVLEMGYIQRDKYWAAGWNDLNGRADFLNDNMSSDRWKLLNEPLVAYNSGKHLLVCGQVPWDASVQHTDHIQWLSDTVYKLRKVSDRKIIVRPHPLADKATPSFVGSTRSTESLDVDVSNAYAVITFSSNIGVDAILAGKAVFCDDVGSMVYGIANRTLHNINAPKYSSRDQWSNNIAYTQWTLEEMSKGLPWKHLTRHMTRVEESN